MFLSDQRLANQIHTAEPATYHVSAESHKFSCVEVGLTQPMLLIATVRKLTTKFDAA